MILWGIRKINKKYEIRKFFFSISQIIRFLQKLPQNSLARSSFEFKLMTQTQN